MYVPRGQGVTKEQRPRRRPKSLGSRKPVFPVKKGSILATRVSAVLLHRKRKTHTSSAASTGLLSPHCQLVKKQQKTENYVCDVAIPEHWKGILNPFLVSCLLCATAVSVQVLSSHSNRRKIKMPGSGKVHARERGRA